MSRAPSLLRGLLPDAVAVCELVPADEHIAELHPAERQAVARAVPKRVRELATGRAAARRAAQALGLELGAVPAKPDRSPAWPSALVGSITHTSDYCAAALARASEYLGLGIDAEIMPERADLPEWAPRICNSEERRWIAEAGEARASLERLLLVFSAKEAFYKAQYPVTRRFLEFQDVALVFDESAHRFRVQASVSLGLGEPIGAFVVSCDLVATAIVLPHV